MRRFLVYILAAALSLGAVSAFGGPGPDASILPPAPADSSALPDTVPAVIAADSTGSDTLTVVPALPVDTVRPRYRMVYTREDLDAAVDFTASDSMLIIRRDSAFMFGDARVTYGEISLDAAEIQMDMRNNTVFALGRPDSTGEIQGKPVFTESGTDYTAETMRYNFESSKGYINNIITQQGEGYLTGGVTKMADQDNFYFQNGRYTTCDKHDNPHFYFQITKGKMRAGKDVVVGPTYMVLAGLPLPLAVPFGYFPFTDTYASGIIIPTFGDDYNRGFYLSDGGYYFAINDNVDLALTGEIYTKGSWGLKARSSYSRRYRYSGSFDLSYLKTVTGEKGDPDYATQTNFQIIWSHSQDAKANPNMNLSASVNFTTSGYTRNNLNSYYSPAFTENTKSSTVNMTYRFPGTKWNLSTTFNVAQRTQDSTLTVSFPNVTVNMGQLAPFKRKKAIGAERWYEKIKMSYTGVLQNSLTANQDEFFKKSLVKDWRNGMKHTIPISATFNFAKYFNVTPSLNFTDRMYTSRVDRTWDAGRNVEVCDTTYSFYNVYDFSASVAVDTKIYGFYQPLGFLGKKIKMIRHVMTPSVSFSGSPDFGSDFFGYYGQYSYVDSRGAQQIRKYSRFPNALFGVPGQGKSGTISYSLANNLEMKVKTDNDSVDEKKISLIENLSINQSYNIAADSLRFSDINTSLLLRLTKGFNLNLSATWDPYMYELNESGNPVKVDKLRIAHGKGLGRLMRTGTSFSYTFNNDTFRRKKTKDKPDDNADNRNSGRNDYADDYGDEGPDDREGGNRDDIQFNPDGYAAWKVPWSLTLNYSINYSYGTFNKRKMEYNGRVTQNLSFSGNIRPTPNWNFSFSASYNFDTHKLAYMNCSVARDLHCFSMRASFVPVGPYKSYNFHISVKSSLLADLKYDKRSSFSNGVEWY